MSMARLPWHAMDAVGEQSPYVGHITHAASQLIPTARKLLSDVHMRFLCDKLVTVFMARYRATLQSCTQGGVSSMGAAQLRMDCNVLKTLLLGLHRLAPAPTEREDAGLAESEAASRSTPARCAPQSMPPSAACPRLCRRRAPLRRRADAVPQFIKRALPAVGVAWRTASCGWWGGRWPRRKHSYRRSSNATRMVAATGTCYESH